MSEEASAAALLTSLYFCLSSSCCICLPSPQHNFHKLLTMSEWIGYKDRTRRFFCRLGEIILMELLCVKVVFFIDLLHMQTQTCSWHLMKRAGFVSSLNQLQESCIHRANPQALFPKRDGKGNCFCSSLCKNNLFFIPRLEMILAKFDEVQNSGGMILSVCKGKSN